MTNMDQPLSSADAPLVVKANRTVASNEDDVLALSPIFMQYWQAVLRWRWVVLGILLSCLALGLIVTLLTPPKYTATSQIEVSRERKNITSVKGLESGNEALDLEFYATQYALLRSKTLAERVSRKLKLEKNAAFLEAHGLSLDDLPSRKRADSVNANSDKNFISKVLLENSAISPIRNSRLIDISYTSRDPELSARIANVWVEEFIGATMDRGFASTADARKFLEDRLNQLRIKLRESEQAVVDYTASEGIVTLSTMRDVDGRTNNERTLAANELEVLNKELTDAQAERIAAESRNRAGAAENSPEVLSNPAIATLRSKRAEVAAEYARILVQFEPEYPEAKALKQQGDALDRAIQREVSRVSNSRALAYREALQRETELRGKVEMMKRELSRQSAASVQKNIYQREADTNRELYDSLLQRYKEIGVAGTVGASNMAVVDVADPPMIPSSPNLPFNAMIALLIGVAIAALTIVGLEQMDKSIRNPEDVQAFLKVPHLGDVPLSEVPPLEALRDPKTRISDAFFSIRSTLAFTTNHGLPKSIVVTSTQPGEGKSTTSISLADVISRTGKKVLLIDGDMRSPSVHSYMGLKNLQGFSNVLAGGDVTQGVQVAPDSALSVMSAGPIPPNPAELLGSDYLNEVLRRMLEIYDHVIIDGPPVLDMADAPSLGRSVEGVVFVVEAERTSRRAILGAMRRLNDVGAQLLGVVVTKIDFSRHGLGYGYGFDYGANYGSGYGYAEKAS